ncbi:MAG TPA: DUF3313 domain-containing protein [Deltaproteobacteria bacterium]|nr:DUF3313 domain-containing protein [Deltaproteobacteria bacterium]
MKKAAMLVMVAAVALQLGGCAVGSYQARSVDLKESQLVNPNILVQGTDDKALYRYVNPKVDFKQYFMVMIDPVLVYKDAELDKNERENYQKLANNAFVYLTQELEKEYQIVKTPEPGTLRIQMAIVDADSSKPVRNTLSTIVPVGIALSIVKYTITGKQAGVGEITAEMKITDASTGELLGAAVDRRVGGKELLKLWSSWNNADDALKYWAKRLSFALCDIRRDPKCVKP